MKLSTRQMETMDYLFLCGDLDFHYSHVMMTCKALARKGLVEHVENEGYRLTKLGRVFAENRNVAP